MKHTTVISCFVFLLVLGLVTVQGLDTSPVILRDTESTNRFTERSGRAPTIGIFSTQPTNEISTKYGPFMDTLMNRLLPAFQWLGITEVDQLPFQIRFVQVKDGKDDQASLYNSVKESDNFFVAPTELTYAHPDDTNYFSLLGEETAHRVSSLVFPVNESAVPLVDLRVFAMGFPAMFTMRLLPTVHLVQSVNDIYSAVKERDEMIRNGTVIFPPSVVIVTRFNYTDDSKEKMIEFAALSAMAQTAGEGAMFFATLEDIGEGWSATQEELCYAPYEEVLAKARRQTSAALNITCGGGAIPAAMKARKSIMSKATIMIKQKDQTLRDLGRHPVWELVNTKQLHYEFFRQQRTMFFLAFLSPSDPLFETQHRILQEFAERYRNLGHSTSLGATPVRFYWINMDKKPSIAGHLKLPGAPALFVGMRALLDTFYNSKDPVISFHAINYFDMHLKRYPKDAAPQRKDDVVLDYPTDAQQLVDFVLYENHANTITFNPIKVKLFSLTIGNAPDTDVTVPEDKYQWMPTRFCPFDDEEFISVNRVLAREAKRPIPSSGLSRIHNIEKIKEELERKRREKVERIRKKTELTREEHRTQSAAIAAEVRRKREEEKRAREKLREGRTFVRRVTDVWKYPKQNLAQKELEWEANVRNTLSHFFSVTDKGILLHTNLE